MIHKEPGKWNTFSVEKVKYTHKKKIKRLEISGIKEKLSKVKILELKHRMFEIKILGWNQQQNGDEEDLRIGQQKIFPNEKMRLRWKIFFKWIEPQELVKSC